MIRLETNIIRNDFKGRGEYKASRKRIKNGKLVKYLHAGIDLLCLPGLPVYATTKLTFERIARPYADGKLTGGVWKTEEGRRVKIFYCRPLDTAKVFYPGDIIARCQNVATSPLMMPHIHIQVYDREGQLINPTDEIEIFS